MHRELANSSQHYHDEYRRRHIRLPEPLERTRLDLRATIGRSLIHLGERLARVERLPQLDEAA
jgi:uncharacterized protein with von Willebrand factor type A (vWA) domain